LPRIIHRGFSVAFSERHLANQTGVQGAFNVLKIAWSDFAGSFLDYEDFGIAERDGRAKLIDTS
jgi:hypothetical protein